MSAKSAPSPRSPAVGKTPRSAVVGTLLIADDEPTVLSTADALLRHRGYETVLATDGREALRQFAATPHRFTAVLIDLTMPGLDGAEVLREIRLLNPTVRVLMMSGFSEQDILNRLQGLGPVAILHKPFTMQTLLARLADVAGA